MNGPRLGVMSVVCGVLAMLLAICGHLAFNAAKKSPVRPTLKRIAIAGITLGYVAFGLMLILTFIVRPTLAANNQRRCLGNLKWIGLAIQIWTGDNKGILPKTFLEMTNELNNPMVLLCPFSSPSPSDNPQFPRRSNARCAKRSKFSTGR